MNAVEKLLLLLEGTGDGSRPIKIRQRRSKVTWILQAPNQVCVDIGRMFSDGKD